MSDARSPSSGFSADNPAIDPGAGSDVGHLPGDAPRGSLRIFIGFVLFSLLFSGLFPWIVCRYYGIAHQPQDFFSMPKPGGDYVATYVAGRSLRQGRDYYRNYPDTVDMFAAGDISRYTYAPPQAYLLSPLSFLSYEASYRAWTWITLALVAVSAFFASRLFESPWCVFFSICMLIYPSSFIIFEMERGQTNTLPLACVVLCLYFYLKRRNVYAAAFFCALGAALKVSPGLLLLFFFVRRDIRAIAATLVWFALIVLVTGPAAWLTWINTVVPAYKDLYIGYTIDHSLAYFFEGFTQNVESARVIARIAAYGLAALYVGALWLNRDRARHVLIEIAILSIIMQITTPWSVNYKLVMLVFVFAAPFAILSLPQARRRPIAYALPFFLAFIPVIPYFSEVLTRLPYSIYARYSVGDIVVSNPVDPFITDRRVAVAVLVIFSYLVLLYLWAGVQSRPGLAAWLARRAPRLGPGAIAACAITVVVFVVALRAAQTAVQARDEARAAIARFGPARPINESVAVAGYRIECTSPARYWLTLVYRSKAPMPHNLQVYLHVAQQTPKGPLVYGRNFFPSIITSMWPYNAHVTAATDLHVPPGRYEMTAGFFDMSNGDRYGETVLGTVDFPDAPAARPPS